MQPSTALHHPDLLLTQPVQRIDQPIKPAIRGGDLRSQHALFVRHARGLACFVQRQHLLHQPHDVVVASNVGGVGEVDGAWMNGGAQR